MCHIFFIHSSVDGYLGWFHVLAIVNSAAMNIVVHDSFKTEGVPHEITTGVISFAQHLHELQVKDYPII